MVEGMIGGTIELKRIVGRIEGATEEVFCSILPPNVTFGKPLLLIWTPFALIIKCSSNFLKESKLFDSTFF